MSVGYFGGHQTFVLRSTWLSRGCKLLMEEDTVDFSQNEISDSLGIGKNMAKSLAFWLRASLLGEKVSSNNHLKLSEYGSLIYQNDPYFQKMQSVWFLHICLTISLSRLEVFNWGFNDKKRGKFEQKDLFESFKFHTQVNLKKEYSDRTLNDDVRCFLNSYAYSLSQEVDEMKEGDVSCPLEKLKLLLKYPKTKVFEFSTQPKKPSIFMVGFLLALNFYTKNNTNEFIELSLTSVLHEVNSPGLILNIDFDIFDLLLLEHNKNGLFWIKKTKLVDGVGILLKNKRPVDWLERSYQEGLK